MPRACTEEKAARREAALEQYRARRLGLAGAAAAGLGGRGGGAGGLALLTPGQLLEQALAEASAGAVAAAAAGGSSGAAPVEQDGDAASSNTAAAVAGAVSAASSCLALCCTCRQPWTTDAVGRLARAGWERPCAFRRCAHV